MLLTAFIDKLGAALPESNWRLAADNSRAVIFPAQSPDFGDIKVVDDGDELTVYCGRFTHSHFNCYGTDLPEPSQVDAIASQAVDFLKAVFSDRVVFFGSHSGWGGFRYKGYADDLAGCPTYVWSGRDA
jgi:hypothetical protein